MASQFAITVIHDNLGSSAKYRYMTSINLLYEIAIIGDVGLAGSI
jgi:hypothetical protein